MKWDTLSEDERLYTVGDEVVKASDPAHACCRVAAMLRMSGWYECDGVRVWCHVYPGGTVGYRVGDDGA